MRYRITLVYYLGPLVGDTYQWIEFDAPEDAVAIEHFQYEAEAGWQHHTATLDRIDHPETKTELQRKLLHNEDDPPS